MVAGQKLSDRSPLDTEVPGDESDFLARIQAQSLRPLWARPEQPTAPLALVRPWVWHYAPARALLLEAAERLDLGGKGGVDRRVLTMANPSLPDLPTTRTLSGALQLVHPGETAPSHRHSLAALRFIIEGEGGRTVVDGEPVPMEPGDVVLTPGWSWHGHVHEGPETMVWLDVLDGPLVRAIDVAFHEEYSSPKSLQPVVEPSAVALATASTTDLLPTSSYGETAGRPPLRRFGIDATLAVFETLKKRERGDGTYSLRFTDPRSGGSVMPTIGAGMQLIEGGAQSPLRRDTANRIYHVARGTGFSIIDGERFDWGPHDTFCVPTWCAATHGAQGGEALLFVADDEPAQRALSLYRDEAEPPGRSES
ncbi:MAG TPA: cupin domain-containing protein [Acidimicrobiales bacterium]|nr:cupin domain-containing protein [Acidimicrobiales bacterium]